MPQSSDDQDVEIVGMMEHIVLLVVFGAAETLEQCYPSGNPSWESLGSIQLSDMSPRSSRVK